MKQITDKDTGIYNGYLILLTLTVSLFVLAEIFTHVLRITLRILTAFLLICFIVGFLGSRDKLKRSGRKLRKLWQRLLLIPISIALIWINFTILSVPIQSILTGTMTAVMLWLIKPQKRKEETST